MIKFIDLEERNRIADAFRQNQGPLLPATIDEAVDGKVSLADMEKGLTIRFPFVDGMRVGGRYHVSLLSTQSTFGQGGLIEEENQDITVEVPADRALQFKGQEARLSSSYSEFEEPNAPVARFSFEALMYPPLVDEAVDGVIPVSVLSQGAHLRIRVTPVFTQGALVSVYWWGSSADACFVKHLTIGPGTAEDLILPIEPAYLTPIKYGHARIIYTVQSTAGIETSPLTSLEVAGDLAMPEPLQWMDGPASHRWFPEWNGKITVRQETRGMVAGDVAILMLSVAAQFVFFSSFVLRHLVRAADIDAGEIIFEAPAPELPQGTVVQMWSIVDRQVGGAVGSPDLELRYF